MQELRNTITAERRENMLSLIKEYRIPVLTLSDDVRRLAELYVNEGAVPPGYPEDALHLALTTLNVPDSIVSLNFEHIARKWTIDKVTIVNDREGLKHIGIYRPEELLKL